MTSSRTGLEVRAHVLPHLVMPVGHSCPPFGPVVQLMNNPRHASSAAEGSRQDYFFGFSCFTADFLASFFALLFPLPMSALAAW